MALSLSEVRLGHFKQRIETILLVISIGIFWCPVRNGLWEAKGEIGRPSIGKRDAGSLYQMAAKGKNESWSDSRHILKVKPAEVINIGCGT